MEPRSSIKKTVVDMLNLDDSQLEEIKQYNKNIIDEFGADYQVIRSRIKGFLESKEPRLVNFIDSEIVGPSFIR